MEDLNLSFFVFEFFKRSINVQIVILSFDLVQIQEF